jgi:hypothetical protein
MQRFLLFPIILLSCIPTFPALAAELLVNPREQIFSADNQGHAPTLVVADNVNVRNYPTIEGKGGFVFARLSKGDKVYVVVCHGFSEGVYWVLVYIPELKEYGYVSAQYLENNFNNICR